MAAHQGGLDCPLSLERMTEPVITVCGHTFERKSILEWTKSHGSCPICRCDFGGETKLVPNLALRELLAMPEPVEVGLECKCLGALNTVVVKETPLEPVVAPSLASPSDSDDYEEIEEVTYVPATPRERPDIGWGFGSEPTPSVSRGINPFTGEFEDASPTVMESEAANGLLRPMREEQPQKAVVTRRRVKKVKDEEIIVPAAVIDNQQQPNDDDGASSNTDGIPCLRMEVTIHNFGAKSPISASIVKIDDTPLTWRGVADVPEIQPQRSVKVVVLIKLKQGVDVSMAAHGEYTVSYQGKKEAFPFDVSIFAQSLKCLKPTTQGVSNFNVLLFGVAGCGKSSFINKLATLFEGSSAPCVSFAPAGGGQRHVTKKLIAYKIPHTHITLWDTWGYNGNYKDDTLAYIFEGRLPNQWKMGELKEKLVDADSRKQMPSRSTELEKGAATAYQRRIHAAILMVSIDDLEDPYLCAAVAEKFHTFKEFSPILVVNKIDKPFKVDPNQAAPGYFSWLRPWVPPAVTGTVSTVVSASATAAVTAATWIGDTATRAHSGYREKGWAGVVDPKVFESAPPPQPAVPLPTEESRPRLHSEQFTTFDVVTQREAQSSTPYWADPNSRVSVEIRRLVSERCHVSPNSIFLNANYVEQSARNSLMDLQALRIIEESIRRAQLFEQRYGAPDAVLPHDAPTVQASEPTQWKW